MTGGPRRPGVILAGLLLAGCGNGGGWDEFGFRACFDLAPDPVGSHCGFDQQPLDWSWTEEPREGFERAVTRATDGKSSSSLMER